MDALTKPRVELPPPPKETDVVYRAGHWEQDSPLQPGTLTGDFASAKVLFDEGKYHDAERVFRWLRSRAEKQKNEEMAEDCYFWEAESLYAQRKFPDARDTYDKMLKFNPNSRHRAEAVARQMDLLDKWLDDTRHEMQEWKDYEEGKRWLVMPKLFNFDREKPFIQQESTAVSGCVAVYTQDPTGPYADQALYRAGGVSYFRENYNESDNYYSTLVQQFPKSPLMPQALELAIQSKIQVTGGPEYDGRKLVEARELITKARQQPELQSKFDFLDRSLLSINEQQAEKDFNTAELFRRTGHPGSAYFCYELVRRRYPGTDWANKAYDRMKELQTKLEKSDRPKEP